MANFTFVSLAKIHGDFAARYHVFFLSKKPWISWTIYGVDIYMASESDESYACDLAYDRCCFYDQSWGSLWGGRIRCHGKSLVKLACGAMFIFAVNKNSIYKSGWIIMTSLWHHWHDGFIYGKPYPNGLYFGYFQVSASYHSSYSNSSRVCQMRLPEVFFPWKPWNCNV